MLAAKVTADEALAALVCAVVVLHGVARHVLRVRDLLDEDDDAQLGHVGQCFPSS